MHNSTWKKERDLLSEAYNSIHETTHEDDRAALGPDEERQADGSIKNTKTGETVYTPKDKKVTKEEAGEPLGDVDVSDPSVPESPMEPSTQELDADVKDLISLIANPPPEDELIRLGYEGRLSEYVAMLQKKVDAAQAQLDLRKPAEESTN